MTKIRTRKTRMVVCSYNQHARLLSEPLVGNVTKVYSVPEPTPS